MAYPAKPHGIPGTFWNSNQRRNSTLHADARAVATEVTDFLGRHSSMNARRLSIAAGLSPNYVHRILSGDTLEAHANKVRLIRRAMRRIDTTGA